MWKTTNRRTTAEMYVPYVRQRDDRPPDGKRKVEQEATRIRRRVNSKGTTDVAAIQILLVNDWKYHILPYFVVILIIISAKWFKLSLF